MSFHHFSVITKIVSNEIKNMFDEKIEYRTLTTEKTYEKLFL